MTGKRYYITTISDWARHAGSFANSHWFALEQDESIASKTDREAIIGAAINEPGAPALRETGHLASATRIIALIEADEGTHGRLDDDSSFEALPHPLSQKPISSAAQSTLASHGVAPGASTFDTTEILARRHPLLRHRVF
jgi:hypothetical protein